MHTPPPIVSNQPFKTHFDEAFKSKLQQKTSHLSGFYKLSFEQRWEHIHQQLTTPLSADEQKHLYDHMGTSHPDLSEKAVENALGYMSLPLAVATHFKIHNSEMLIPMCTEEPSVVAAASHGAKLMRHNAGIITSSTAPITTAQIQITFDQLSKDLITTIDTCLKQHASSLIKKAQKLTENLQKRGGGARDIDWYFIEPIHSLVILVHIHTADAMGANIANHVAEHLCPDIQRLFSQSSFPQSPFLQSSAGLNILTNLSLKRMVKAECSIPIHNLHQDNRKAKKLAEGIARAYQFAKYDVFRATTHNKGIMNGVVALALATGNDSRAIEAGAHAYASLTGSYQPLSTWHVDSSYLHGSLTMPLSVGVVGGMTQWHPTVAKLSINLLGFPRAQQLAEIMAATGLAQNLAALRSLAGEGIQKGHMKLHRKRTTPTSPPTIKP